MSLLCRDEKYRSGRTDAGWADAWLCPLIAFFWALGGEALAAEWYADPKITLRSEYHDNFRFQDDSRTDIDRVFSLQASPRVDIGASAERWRAEIGARADFKRYDRDQYDSDDWFLDLSTIYGGPRWSLRLDAYATRDSSTTSEVDGAGFVESQATRRRINSVSPSLIWLWREKDRLTFRASLSDTDYQSENFVGYEYDVVDFTWAHTIDPTLRFQVRPFYNRFGSNTEFSTETFGLEAGVSRQLSERWELLALVAGSENVARTKEQECVEFVDFGFFSFCSATAPIGAIIKNTSSSVLGELTLTYSGELLSFSGSLSRSQQPSGVSTLLEQTRVETTVERRMTERMDLTLRAEYFSNEAVEGFNDFDRDVLRITPGIRYWLSERLRLVGQWNTRTQEYTFTDVSADANAVWLTLHYDMRRKSWSR